jgi:lipopolysaccharide/colanic/teichoic acid biosynthesis glycosyltransferase
MSPIRGNVVDGVAQVVDEVSLVHVGRTGLTHHESGMVARPLSSTLVAPELIQPQHGLLIDWSEDRPVLPEMTPARRMSLRAKRMLDIVGALTGLFLFAPLFILVILAIKLTDAGPVFFRQSRIGLNGVPFDILKFRSMYSNLGDLSGRTQTVANDSRVTLIGAIIRKTSIDELPQLINVLLGQMSLVGPRPHVAGMQAAGMLYDELVPAYDYRYLMPPGLTGWAQCHGLRGPTVDRAKAIARIGHDIAYIQHYKFSNDIIILGKTIVSELLRPSAH